MKVGGSAEGCMCSVTYKQYQLTDMDSYRVDSLFLQATKTTIYYNKRLSHLEIVSTYILADIHFKHN